MDYTVHFETLGCRLNQIESEAAARFFADAGFAVDMESMSASAAAPPKTVLSVVNTCTVTGKAEQKARRLIRLLLRKMPDACVLVTGCYAELEAAAIRAIDERVCVLPGSRKDLLADIPAELGNYLAAMAETQPAGLQGGAVPAHAFMRELVARLELEKPSPDNLKGRREHHGREGQALTAGKTSLLAAQKSLPAKELSDFVPAGGAQDGAMHPAFRLSTDTFFAHSRSAIKIQDGCNCECTYCRIHLARGRSVSLDADQVVRRVQRLEAAGQQEVVLTGVNLSQYWGRYSGGGASSSGGFRGRDGEARLKLAGLLQAILDNTRSIRVRISSLYPESVDESLCQVVGHQRIQPYFHLSVQSGSDAILTAMRRPYRSAQVYRAVELLRRAKGNPFIACDIIAGFPGETEEDFALTQRLCEACRFAWVHAFPFSPRPGTTAAAMKGQVPQSVARRRVKWLTSFAIQSKCSYISMWKGQVVSAITEHNRQDRRESSRLTAIGESRAGSGEARLSSGGSKRLTHAVTENFIHLELPGSFPQGISIRVKIGEPLLERIRSGDECEASGEAVAGGLQDDIVEEKG